MRPDCPYAHPFKSNFECLSRGKSDATDYEDYDGSES